MPPRNERFGDWREYAEEHDENYDSYEYTDLDDWDDDYEYDVPDDPDPSYDG